MCGCAVLWLNSGNNSSVSGFHTKFTITTGFYGNQLKQNTNALQTQKFK